HPASSAPRPPPAPPPAEPPLSGTPPSSRTIAGVPGHGGDAQGAKGAGGKVEKDLTLAVARRLKAAVEARLGIRVILTRDDDRNIPIDDRAAIANNNKADFFVSIHANASFRSVSSGA